MKTKRILQFAILTFLFTACMSPAYFQVYKTEPTDKNVIKNNSMSYEDENCKVSYDFWGENGDIGFRFFNKTDKTIYLNLKECYFVLNGIAQDYFQNRTVTNSKNTGTTSTNALGLSKSITGLNHLDLLQTNKLIASNSTGVTSNQGYSVSYTEAQTISIPSNTAKIISEFSINNTLYGDCILYKYPTKKQIATKNFTKSSSPFVFSNLIVYTVENNLLPNKFVNEFYVTEITNYAQADITDKKYEEFCDQKNSIPSLFFKDTSPDKFYIKYTKGMDTWIH